MEYITRGNSTSKRGRKASVFSENEADIKSPLQKKSKHRRSSSNTRSHLSTSSGADYSQDKIDMDIKSLISIRNATEDLRYMEKEFHQEQQRRYEKFHQLQQKRYSELVERIDDIVQWLDGKGRIHNQVVKQGEGDENGGGDASSRLRDRTAESVASGTGSTDVGKATAGLTFSFRKINSVDLESHLSDMCKTGHETESSQEMGESDLPQFAPQEEGNQPVGSSNLINGIGKRRQISKLASSSKSTDRRQLMDRRMPKGPIISMCSDSSDGDVEDSLLEDFQMARSPQDIVSQSSGILNEDGAIEGTLIGSRSTGAEIREQQHRSPPPLPIFSSDQDQLQPHPVGQNVASASNRARNTCPKSGRSLRKIPRVDYEQRLLPLGESDEDNSSPPTRVPTRTPSKAAKAPMRPKSKKIDEVPDSDDGSYRPNPTVVNTTGRASPKKKGAPKSISRTGNRSLFDFWPTPARKPTGGGDDQPPSPSKSGGEPEPTPNAQKDPRTQLPDAASKFKAVRTAPVP